MTRGSREGGKSREVGKKKEGIGRGYLFCARWRHKLWMQRALLCHSPGLDKGEQGGREIESDDQLALLHIQPLLRHSCGDDNVQLSSLQLAQNFMLCLLPSISKS